METYQLSEISPQFDRHKLETLHGYDKKIQAIDL